MGGKKPSTPAPLEPIKSAEEAVKQAQSDASRSQQLRRGLSSAFSRSTFGAGASQSTATSGQSTKLGA